MSGGSMRERALRGTIVSVAGHGFQQVLRLAGNVALTRLLFPEAFGLMAVVNALLMGLELISDLGIYVSLIQHPREDRDFLDTAYTLQVIRGFVLWGLGSLAAYPAALLFDEPQLTALVPVAAFQAVLGGLVPTKVALLQRRLQLGRLMTLSVASQPVGLLVMVVHAALFQSVWALVIGTLTMSATKVVLSHLIVEGPADRLRMEKEARDSLLSFGKWVFLSTLVTFIPSRFDAALGRVESLEVLGVFAVAGTFAQLPVTLGGQVIGSVLLPALSESARVSRAELASSFARARRVVLPLVGLFCLGIALFAPVFFDLLYDDRYRGATALCRIALLWVWFNFLHDAWGRTLLAIGESRPIAASNVVKAAVTVTAALGGHAVLGIEGFILGMALGALAGHAVILWSLAQKGLAAHRDDLVHSLGTLGIGLLGLKAGDLALAAIDPAARSGLSFSFAFDALGSARVFDVSPETTVSGLVAIPFVAVMAAWAARRVLARHG